MESTDWITPSCLEDITEEWVYNFIFHICSLPPTERKKLSILSINITSSLNSGEGALSDICHVSVRAQLKDKLCDKPVKDYLKTIGCHEEDTKTSLLVNSQSCDKVSDRESLDDISSPPDRGTKINFSENEVCLKAIDYNLFIKLVPESLKHLINKHGLFEKEIFIYR